MKKTLSLLLFIFPTILFAQVTGSVRGFIIDNDTKEPLPYVTIALMPEGSSIPTKGSTTDDSGKFNLTGIKPGKYTVTASFVGYLNDTQNINITTGKKDVDLGKISLKSDRKLLKEVVITEQRSQMSFEIDSTINLPQGPFQVWDVAKKAEAYLEQLPNMRLRYMDAKKKGKIVMSMKPPLTTHLI